MISLNGAEMLLETCLRLLGLLTVIKSLFVICIQKSRFQTEWKGDLRSIIRGVPIEGYVQMWTNGLINIVILIMGELCHPSSRSKQDGQFYS